MVIIIKTVDEIELTCMNDIWKIVVGYIRYYENRKLSKHKIEVLKQISKDMYSYCEKSDTLKNKIDEFKKTLYSQNNSEIINNYADAIDFLENYTVHKEILSNYKKKVNKSGTDSLYEFLLKIGDVIRMEIHFPQKEEGDYNRPHTKLELNNYDPLGKKLLECNQDEITFTYSKIEEIIYPTKLPINVKQDKLFWWDKETISSQSKACRGNGYIVKNYNNEEEKVTFIRIVNEFQYKDELSEEIVKKNRYIEGAFLSVLVNRYERNPKARQKCIDYHGCKCDICGFDFGQTYGEIGKNYIEVHHKVPLNEIKEQYEVDPINDLIPVCSNCHSIIHRKTPSLAVEELKLIRKRINSKI